MIPVNIKMLNDRIHFSHETINKVQQDSLIVWDIDWEWFKNGRIVPTLEPKHDIFLESVVYGK